MKRENWIDVGKFFATIAVILSHIIIDRMLWFALYSVTLFILLSGVTSYISFTHKKGNFSYINYIHRKVKPILITYAIATVIYSIFTKGSFDLKHTLNLLVHFNASGPFYYISVYVQLLLIAPLLYKILIVIDNSKFMNLKQFIFIITLIIISVILTKHTNILNIPSAGKRLFGGTYLPTFYIGMFFSSKIYDKPRKIEWMKSFVFFVSLIALIMLVTIKDKMILDFSDFFKNTINPPNITIFVYSLLIFLFIFYFFTTLELTNKLTRITFILAWIGQHSLYIFLYHMLVKIIIQQYIEMLNIGYWLKVIIYTIFMMGVPVMFYRLFLKMKKIFSTKIFNKQYD